MSYFWAKFEKVGEHIFRYDTRIYLCSINKPTNNDVCIGAIVGKNPGSAKANNENNPSLQEIKLDKDKLLPTVWNIIIKAHNMAGKDIQSCFYVQVLNLFSLCNPDLGEAIDIAARVSNHKFCTTENQEFKWVWYVWGGSKEELNQFKVRFEKLKAKTHFFLNKDTGTIYSHIPESTDFAKHTQGMKHDAVVPFIAGLIKNG